ncbi:MAG: hypothetical protein COU32_00205 [Candidatus Magasanikbacteria bacterium CG10_big_fil_rev_8_21_14_0_10_42_10]|uniref:Plastocyanin-like domain-containing protein n=2 Tax=Candidatus Magasanikiibacteriota TaxID=1752731 RepID=A0A2H0TX91_9BACT|nr:MAG: hypothetical protein COU32_00205 [Candidatus Magasanikbacteria bacterium CG10_big_fil_rev_8_21_14_0_10_42_10]PIZ94098.1 MAG: hypothetical protein COX82_01355 [Candidatus Magasanikbacteria bacterium CG_4_10_14_0_2_um_filter_41_10]
MKKQRVFLSLIAMVVLPLVGVGCSSLPTSQEHVDSDTAITSDPQIVPPTESGTNDGVMSDNGSDEATEENVTDAKDMTVTDTNNVTFALTGKNFSFFMDGQTAPVLKVKEGSTVHIDFTSEGGFHDWKIDEFSAATERVQSGDTTSIEFVANKKGTFEYYCSVGSHRANGMFGTLIVE